MRIGTGLVVRSRGRVAAGAGLPEDLAEDAETEFGIGRRKMEAVDEAADFFVGGGGGAALGGSGGGGFQVAAGAEGFEEDGGDALEFCGRGDAAFLGRRGGFGIAGEFVEADGYGLAEIHGAMVFAGGNAEEPVAMAEVFVGEAAFFGAEEKSDVAGGEALANEAGGRFE